MHGAPMYIAETAPSKVRGTLISLKEAFIVGGILVSFLLENTLVSCMLAGHVGRSPPSEAHSEHDCFKISSFRPSERPRQPCWAD